jgi:hypothetical protein
MAGFLESEAFCIFADILVCEFHLMHSYVDSSLLFGILHFRVGWCFVENSVISIASLKTAIAEFSPPDAHSSHPIALLLPANESPR